MSAAFRDQMVGTVLGVSHSRRNGFFINSCFTHGQSEYATWKNAYGSPSLQNKVPTSYHLNFEVDYIYSSSSSVHFMFRVLAWVHRRSGNLWVTGTSAGLK